LQVDANLKLVGFDAEADFDAIVSADLFERLKPAPDIFLAAAKEVGVEPSACIVVEDAAAGVQAARAAGQRTLLNLGDAITLLSLISIVRTGSLSRARPSFLPTHLHRVMQLHLSNLP
jgi:beta-phosphoglucomutase-like phosphatase (HAD superfamily)